jgi:hypothetical protein
MVNSGRLLERYCRHGIIGLVLLILLLGGSVQATALDVSTATERIEQTSQSMERLRALTLSLLRQIKAIQSQYGEASPPAASAPVSVYDQLAAIELLKDSFDRNHLQLSRSIAELQRDLGQSEGDWVDNAKEQVSALEGDLEKYRRVVNKAHEQTIDRYGKPAARTPDAPETPLNALQLRGEIRGTLGQATHKRPNASPAIDASQTEFGFDVTARANPSQKVGLTANLNRQSTVERREITLSGFGASVDYKPNSAFTGTAGFRRTGYGESDADTLDYADFQLFANAKYKTDIWRLNGRIQRTSRGYDELEIADFTTTGLTCDGTMLRGLGNMKFRLHYQKKDYSEVDGLDVTDFHPQFTWETAPNGIELGASYQSLSYPEADDSPLATKRLKAHLYRQNRGGGTRSYWGPEVARYSYPNRENSDFYDFKLVRHSQSAIDGYRTNSLRIVYRMYPDSGNYDFAQMRWQKNSRPSGSGGYGQFTLAARYYTEGSDSEGASRFSNLRPAHTVDLYWSFGWSRALTGMFKEFSFGPVLGARMYIDNERDDAYGDFNDVDYILQNPQNTARFGGKVTLAGSTPAGMRIRGELSYVHSILYNAEPSRSTGMLNFFAQVSYPINPRLMTDFVADYHRTRADIDSSTDLDKTGVKLQVRYLFNVQQ